MNKCTYCINTNKCKDCIFNIKNASKSDKQLNDNYKDKDMMFERFKQMPATISIDEQYSYSFYKN